MKSSLNCGHFWNFKRGLLWTAGPITMAAMYSVSDVESFCLFVLLGISSQRSVFSPQCVLNDFLKNKSFVIILNFGFNMF